MSFAAMRASKALPVLIPSLLQAHFSIACRVSPFLAPKDHQCFSTASAQNQHSTFSYRLSASFTGKGTQFKPTRDTYTFSPSLPSHKKYPPAQESRPNSGQDAFFITSVGSTSNVAFGIADGVGGWSDSGIDPADFSHGLCNYMASRATEIKISQAPYLRPSALLQGAYDDVSSDPSVPAGGSTACIAVARTDGLLEVANLGDSGFVQLRPHKIQYFSEPQIHAFNTPYQLSLIPPAILARSRAFGGEPLHDMPSDAQTTNHTVRHGDVLVFASDGVWDNLSAGDVLDIVGRYMSSMGGWVEGAPVSKIQPKAPASDPIINAEGGQAPLKPGTSARSRSPTARREHQDHSQGSLLPSPDLDALTQEGGLAGKERSLQAALAVAIAGEAKLASEDPKRDGPFAREVHLYYPSEDYHGGKVDDISVVVGVVVGES